MTMKLATHGGDTIEKALNAKVVKSRRKHRDATRASAKVFQRVLKGMAKGKLKRAVKVYPLGETSWKVKIVGSIGRFVLGDTKAHEIDPRGSDAAQGTFHSIKRGRAMMSGPAMAKRALSYSGASHPFARAMMPAHSGDHTLVPRARAEGDEAARVAAMEVLRS